MKREQMIEKLSEIDLDAFYSQSTKNQERELKLIFSGFYDALTDEELKEIISEWQINCEVEL
jgi:hypothetical protein